MKKLHSLAFYALVAPVMTLGASTVLAEKSVDGQKQGAQSYQGADKSDSQKATDRLSSQNQSRMQGQGYISAVPANGKQASELMGADVRTTDDEEIGAVNDLIINEDGQVVAIVVSVGGFLGMGEKDVAIGWDHVTRSGAADEDQLRVDVTRDDLLAAPEFEMQE